MSRRVAVAMCLVFGLASAGAAGERLVVHEWGTFTSFQNEIGESLRRINTDDEPVPPFVHQLGRVHLFKPTDLWLERSEEKFLTQGAPTADPRVTMRLETPVLYFHLPPGEKTVTLDVGIDFRRGFLTQFFPLAEATVDGRSVKNYGFPAGHAPLGSLRWSNVRVGEAGVMPETTERVWLAPRQVNAAPVTVGEESERFLFYRGVGDVAAPLQVIRHADQNLEVRFNLAALQQLDAQLQLAEGSSARAVPRNPTLASRMSGNSVRGGPPRQWSFWLLDVRPDGTSAFRPLSRIMRQDEYDHHRFYTPGNFPDTAFSKDNLAKLRTGMRAALVGDGLFGDEADALLNTWELSYFLSPGQRLFFLVPRAWTDAVLPLKLSVPADVTRVMVGRIELVTPRQRELVRQIANTPVTDLTTVVERMHALKQDPSRREAYNALASGRGDTSILGVPVPPIYQAFLDLGRFRTSLLMDSLERDIQAEAGHMDRVRHLQFELIHPGKLQRE